MPNVNILTQSAILCAIIHYSRTAYGYGKLYVRMVCKFNNFQFVYILVKCWWVIPDNEICSYLLDTFLTFMNTILTHAA